MTLVEHLRELRARLFRSLLAVLVGGAVAWFFYSELFALLDKPFADAQAKLAAQGSHATLALTGVADAFNIQLEICFAAGVVLAAPVWMYQFFRFVTPGLHSREKRWAGLFVASALPLFLAGIAVGYFVAPRMLNAFLGFTPKGVANIISVDRYLSFIVQLMVAFGIGCVAPVFVVVLNTTGLLTAARFASWWRWVLIFTLVFAALATPTGDPINMALFAAPILLLMLIAFFICWLNDRRRARRDRETGFGDLSDDETSPLTFHRADDLPVVEPVEVQPVNVSVSADHAAPTPLDADDHPEIEAT